MKPSDSSDNGGPSLHGAPIELASVLKLGAAAHHKKKWPEVVKYYGLAIQHNARGVPAYGFTRLAVAQRLLKDYTGSGQTLELGLSIHPRYQQLLVELAALSMHRGDWEGAAAQWQRCLALGQFTALNYNRYARACEVLERWDVHESVVGEGLSRFPDDEALLTRQAYAQAHRHLSQGRWRDATGMFGLLESHVLKLWPFATRLYTRQARIGAALESAHTDEERLEVLRARNGERTALPRPEQFAGLSTALTLTRETSRTDERLADELLNLLKVMQNFDTDIKSLDNPWVRERVSRVASVATPEAIASLNLPGPYYRTLARTLLRYGHWTRYWLFRERFVESLKQRRIGKSAPVSHADLVDQVVLANELGDHEYFRELEPRVAEHASTARRDAAIFLCLSRLCHGEYSASPRPWTRHDASFAAAVRGKTVALVGPVAGEHESGEEIDSFDWVVRFNHRGTVHYDPGKCGTKTHLSWYLHSKLPVERSADFLDAMNGLDYVVLDQWAEKKCAWLTEVRAPKRNRLEGWKASVNPLLFGSPNGVQRVLMDLLRFDVGRVKVFNANLFLDLRYTEGYRKPQKDLCFPLSLHDPVSNFVLLKRFHETGVMEADSVLSEVLALDRKEYFDALAARYGTEE